MILRHDEISEPGYYWFRAGGPAGRWMPVKVVRSTRDANELEMCFLSRINEGLWQGSYTRAEPPAGV